MPVAVFEGDQYCHIEAVVLCLLCGDQQGGAIDCLWNGDSSS